MLLRAWWQFSRLSQPDSWSSWIVRCICQRHCPLQSNFGCSCCSKWEIPNCANPQVVCWYLTSGLGSHRESLMSLAIVELPRNHHSHPTLFIMVRIQTLWWRYSNELFNCLSCRLMAIKPLPNCNSFRPTPISYNPQSNTFPSFHFLYTLPPNPPGFLLTICVRLWGVRWAGGWMWVSPS